MLSQTALPGSESENATVDSVCQALYSLANPSEEFAEDEEEAEESFSLSQVVDDKTVPRLPPDFLQRTIFCLDEQLSHRAGTQVFVLGTVISYHDEAAAQLTGFGKRCFTVKLVSGKSGQVRVSHVMTQAGSRPAPPCTTLSTEVEYAVFLFNLRKTAEGTGVKRKMRRASSKVSQVSAFPSLSLSDGGEGGHLCDDEEAFFESVQVPPEFVCPISLRIMVDPVMTILGTVSYERSMIETMISTQLKDGQVPRDPVTNSDLVAFSDDNVRRVMSFVIPNRSLQQAIQTWKASVLARQEPTKDEHATTGWHSSMMGLLSRGTATGQAVRQSPLLQDLSHPYRRVTNCDTNIGVGDTVKARWIDNTWHDAVVKEISLGGKVSKGNSGSKNGTIPGNSVYKVRWSDGTIGHDNLTEEQVGLPCLPDT
jgi:hypothetical protein